MGRRRRGRQGGGKVTWSWASSDLKWSMYEVRASRVCGEAVRVGCRSCCSEGRC